MLRFPSLALAAALVLQAFTHADDFKPLFNGRDLSGWVNVNCAPETWKMRDDGVLFCTGKPTGALRTERQYENFIFEAEWRHMKPGGNAGIFIWSGPITAPGVPFLKSIEVQVLDHGHGESESYTTHGDVFPIHGSTMKPFGRSKGMRSFPSEKRSRPSPEWNHYRVECRDGVLRLHVNGKEVSGGENCNWRKGYLALESEGGEVEWRNLRIQELPPGNTPPAESAPEAQGHRSLYNGLDLRGWKTGTPDRWQPSDWKLRLKPGAAGEPLWTEAEFGNCEVIIDCRLPEKAPADGPEPAVLVRSEGQEIARLPLAGLKPGKWSRFIVNLRSGERTVTRDGEEKPHHTLVSLEPAGKRQSLGLQDIGAEVEFASIYVRELPQ